jgi:hypothetical protein
LVEVVLSAVVVRAVDHDAGGELRLLKLLHDLLHVRLVVVGALVEKSVKGTADLASARVCYLLASA